MYECRSKCLLSTLAPPRRETGNQVMGVVYECRSKCLLSTLAPPRLWGPVWLIEWYLPCPVCAWHARFVPVYMYGLKWPF